MTVSELKTNLEAGKMEKTKYTAPDSWGDYTAMTMDQWIELFNTADCFRQWCSELEHYMTWGDYRAKLVSELKELMIRKL